MGDPRLIPILGARSNMPSACSKPRSGLSTINSDEIGIVIILLFPALGLEKLFVYLYTKIFFFFSSLIL